MKKIFILILTIIVFAGCNSKNNQIVVGSKNFSEQVLLSEIIAQQIENKTRLKVQRKLNLGGSFICHTALTAGEMDTYVEYTGTALTAILKMEPQNDPSTVFKIVHDSYMKQFNLEWLKPLGFNNTFAILIRGEDARKLGIKTISEAARYAPQWIAGFGYEFMERKDGYPGMATLYGLKFKEPPRVMDLTLSYKALANKQIDFAAGDVTNGVIAKLDLFVLEDDQHYFPPYEAAPVIRSATLAQHPELRDVLNQLGGKISADEMRRLNAEVDVDHRDVKQVAAEFLKETKIIAAETQNNCLMSFKDYKPEPDLSLASTIPSRWYTDPAFLEFEKEKIFSKTWQPVSRTELLQRPGDFHTCEIAGEPLVVTNGTDGRLHALTNVCRHRAGPVAVGKGNRKSLQCRYHGWTYGLDGRLLTQPDFEGVKNWNKDEICLPSAAVESWGPFVYVNLKPHPMPLREYMGKINDEVQEMGVDLKKMRLIEGRDYIVNCNWKVYIDNYLEGYHIPIAHPELFREVDYEQYRVDTFRYYSSANAPIRDLKPGDLQGRDRRYVRSTEESKALYYWVFPNWMINIYPDNLQFNHILPLDHQQTLTIFEWYFNDPGSASGWESLNESIAFSDQIQKEDIEICEAVQRGLKSKTYDRGRFSVKRENGVHHFHMLLHEFLTAET